jgi:hypothetical protein
MNESTPPPEDSMANASREEIMSALFANMIIQQTQMAMMLLGKVAHPDTGKFMKDVEAAQMFIDQLEMLEAKTKGNLNKQEEGLLKQALTALHMSFVDAVEGSPAPQPPQSKNPPLSSGPAPDSAPASAPAPAEAKQPEAPQAETQSSDESRKKFSKKY